MLEKFSLADPVGARQYYSENGYVIFGGLIPSGRIDRFLQVYEHAKGDKWFIFPTQSTHRPYRFLPDAHGHIPESMENPAFMVLRPAFSAAVMDCLTDPSVAQALRAIDGRGEHVLWQSMFFDKSTGTVAHQDSWYLDTEPRGALVGAWYALEDIAHESGPFFVYPGSHRIAPVTDAAVPDHDEFVARIATELADSNYSMRELEVAKGDVILWHPSTVHGSRGNRQPQYSRKSFTAHFYPAGDCTTDSASAAAPTRRLAPGFAARRRNLHAYHARQYLRWGLRQLQGANPAYIDMRSGEGRPRE